MKNRLLSALPIEDFGHISAHLAQVELERGRLIYEPGDPIDSIYFPHDGAISMMTLMQNGTAIHTAMIGREGALGLNAAIAPRESMSRAVVQVPGKAWRIPATVLNDVYQRSAALRDLIDRHNEALFGHAIQSVACNALHAVEARFCRWLLSCDDLVDNKTINVTQEFLADMLGVQRTTVTAVARSLWNRRLIRYSRGVIYLLDRQGLEALACECYDSVRQGYKRLLPALQA